LVVRSSEAICAKQVLRGAGGCDAFDDELAAGIGERANLERRAQHRDQKGHGNHEEPEQHQAAQRLGAGRTHPL